MIHQSELELKHALNVVTLHQKIRSLLATTFTEQEEWSNEVIELITCIEKSLQHTPDNYYSSEWKLTIAGLRVLASQITCEKIAETGQGNLIEEETKCRTLQTKLKRLLLNNSFNFTENSFFQQFSKTGQCNPDELHDFLSLLPLPTFYWHSHEINFSDNNANKKELKNESSPVLRIIVFIDQIPIASPQLLQPNIQYSLTFKVRGFIWLQEAIRLKLDFITTCPESDYSFSKFILEKPSVDNNEYEAEIIGKLSFKMAQSHLLDDLVFQLRAAFEMLDGNFKTIPIIGHGELRLKVINDYPIKTGNKFLDKYVTELVMELLKKYPKILDELPDLLPILDALTHLRATYFHNEIWKGQSKVSEPEFQKKVMQDLQLILGIDVQAHTEQAGGFTDIRYRGVIIELKVERQNGEREYIAKKYTSQPAQYSGIEARQVSILLVLDLTEKKKSTGDIRDDIFLKDVETHGGNDVIKKFPSKAFIFVINGNTKSPSDYSK